jgi:hypothetical protein
MGAEDIVRNPKGVGKFTLPLLGNITSASTPAQEAKAETAATGDLLVAVGVAYLTYGQAGKAASVISQGIAKGGLQHPDQANLLLGMAQLKSQNVAGARATFEKVGKSDNEGYAQLGKLWGLHAQPNATA